MAINKDTNIETFKRTKELKKICKVITFFEDSNLVKSHSRDWRGRKKNIAMAVAFPKSSLEISKLVKYCCKKNITIIPQGGNTGLVYGTSPIIHNEELIVSTEKLNKVIQLDKINKFIEAQSGVIVKNLSDLAKAEGFIFPTDMSSSGSSQLGGIIATNAGGMNVIRYGSTRENLLDLEVVLASGEILKLGSKVIKDNSGYNIKSLFCGSEGTLGIITKASIKLHPMPLDYINCFVSINDLKNVVYLANLLTNQFNDNIESIELIPDLAFMLCEKHKLIKGTFFEKRAKYYILIKFALFESNDQFYSRIEKFFLKYKNNIIEVLLSQNENQSRKFWKFRDSITEAQRLEGQVIPFDISIPIDRLEIFLKEAKNGIDKILPNVKYYTFGHLGDSNLHFNLIEPDKFGGAFFSYEPKFKKLVLKLVKKYNGSISAEHGIGILKKSDLIKSKSKAEIDLMKKIKKIFDPNNILNTNKILDS